ncbi:hypothetical protein EDM59_23155 [Brevibacillus nitrificans]|uniref:Phage tail tape measure protein n=2 Tax=Brevibacillus nitrificans TaxID=651560 RepID=A0A3M8CZ30_9BACL|nr:hypothetical protein EDM59_23155 [Brevibacillus nitrificans]
MQQMSQQFASGMEQMQLQVQKLREEMGKASQEKVPTFFEKLTTFSNKVGELNQKIVGLANDLSKVAMGASLDEINNEAKAAAKERRLYAAKGKTPQQMKQFDELARKLAIVNPDLNRAQAMSLISKSEQLNPKQAEKYAEHAAKLSVTTRFAPEDHLKMMAAMKQGTGIDTGYRLANAIQYMSNHAGDLDGKFVESIVEFSAKNGALLDTPEKMASVVSEIGSLGIWNNDKALGALSESTLKLSEKGELTKLLTTQFKSQGKGKEAAGMAEKEASSIELALKSGDREEQKVALGKMMLSLSSIKDKTVQQKVLEDLGGTKGKELGADFPFLLERVGKIASGETRTEVGNDAEKSYQAAIQSDAYFQKSQAQATARQEAIDAATLIAKDTSNLFSELSTTTASVIKGFNGLDSSLRQAIEMVVIGVAGLGSIGAVTGLVPMFGDVIGIARDIVKGKNGSATPGTDAGGSTEGDPTRTQAQDQGQRQVTGADVNDAQSRTNQQQIDTGNETNGGNDSAKNPSLLSRAKDKLSKWKDSLSLQNTKGIFKKIPLLGTALGLTSLFKSKNKLEAAGQLGSEAIWSWGGTAAGAATGAAIGSIVPIIGTAAGGVIGGLLGGFGGSMLGSAAFDGIKSMFSSQAEQQPVHTMQALPSGPSVPGSSPAGEGPVRSQNVTITVPQITIPLHADGVLQDIPTMLKMLGDPTVGQKIKSIIEKALLDALETRGGVPV